MPEIVESVLGAVNGSGYTVPFIINGEEVHPKKSFPVVSPATGKEVHNCGSASDVEVVAAVDAAAKAFTTWKKTTPQFRRDIFLKAAAIVEKRRDELARYMIDETGCPRHWSDFNLSTMKEFLVDVAGRISNVEGSIPTTEKPDVGALILKEPYGVILAIAPW
jgi:acyl-CoA reductase-like NAD-dependent aldehyde dehydrogenase